LGTSYARTLANIRTKPAAWVASEDKRINPKLDHNFELCASARNLLKPRISDANVLIPWFEVTACGLGDNPLSGPH
jgi:hypothetical protein